MPVLSELKITQFRNLGSVAIQPSSGINLIYGENGSGKTSLLEAISVLAHGRSFRTHKFRRLINDDEGEFTVFAKLNAHLGSGNRGEVKVGINRKRGGECLIRVDGQTVNSATDLASQLPLLVMDAHSFSLLEGAAKVRRQFFDWLVFHVKHEFRGLWRDYQKCLKNRNSLLRRDKISAPELDPWDREFVSLSHGINKLRDQVLGPFLEAFAQTACQFGFNRPESVNLIYTDGWKGDEPFEIQLKETFERDRKQGFTSLGPHKSDLKISLGKVPAVEILSRGQQKLLISALIITEARVHQRFCDQKAVFLLDDMPAELDKAHLSTLAGWLNDLGSQLFVTGVEAQRLKEVWPNYSNLDHAMFHVKHGEVKPAK